MPMIRTPGGRVKHYAYNEQGKEAARAAVKRGGTAIMPKPKPKRKPKPKPRP